MKKKPTSSKIPDNPLPTKFDPTDRAWLELLRNETGLNRSMIIRRAVRLLAAEVKARPDWNWVQDTANPMSPPPKSLTRAAKGDESFSETNARARATAEAERRAKLAEAEAEATRLAEEARAAEQKVAALRDRQP